MSRAKIRATHECTICKHQKWDCNWVASDITEVKTGYYCIPCWCKGDILQKMATAKVLVSIAIANLKSLSRDYQNEQAIQSLIDAHIEISADCNRLSDELYGEKE